ncbi:MAG: hypothetical protein RL693_2345 [Verrucomicrobiota bacterium]
MAVDVTRRSMIEAGYRGGLDFGKSSYGGVRWHEDGESEVVSGIGEKAARPPSVASSVNAASPQNAIRRPMAAALLSFSSFTPTPR